LLANCPIGKPDYAVTVALRPRIVFGRREDRKLLPRINGKAMNKHSRIRTPSKFIALLATVSALWLVGPVALAQAGNSTNDQYRNEVQKVSGSVGGGSDGPSSGLQKKVVGGLPFTGLDVVALLAVAVALTSMGLALRRLTAERHVS
jgi:hypothetical protein